MTIIIQTGKDIRGLLRVIGRKEQVCLVKIILQPRHQLIMKIKSRLIGNSYIDIIAYSNKIRDYYILKVTKNALHKWKIILF